LTKKVFFFTGKIGGYYALKPFLDKIKKIYSLKIIAADQHNSKLFGNSYKKLIKDFGSKQIIRINLGQKNDSVKSRMLAFSNLIKKFSILVSKEKPDMLIVYGDRGETLLASFIGVNYSIPIVHFQGGDLSGNVDEIFRHSITKLSNFHFSSNLISKERIISLGESPKNVFNHGDNHLDRMKIVKKISPGDLSIKINLSTNFLKNFVIMHYHPETYNTVDEFKNTKTIIQTLIKNKYNIICIYPCNDQGYKSIIECINLAKKKFPDKINFFKHIDSDVYISLLKSSKFFIGNSSTGIIETPFLKKWSINIGSRQKSRLKSKLTLNAKPNQLSILRQIKFINNNKPKKDNLYGSANSYVMNFNVFKKLIKKKNYLKEFYE
jgi:UDP-hydrolysing UDP-N-acetyl-D-glucosamine 2-epimerase